MLGDANSPQNHVRLTRVVGEAGGRVDGRGYPHLSRGTDQGGCVHIVTTDLYLGDCVCVTHELTDVAEQ